MKVSFFLSAVLAIPLGILMAAYKCAEAAPEPFVGFVRYVPFPALIPLVMVIAGIDEPAKSSLIFLGTYFQIVSAGPGHIWSSPKSSLRRPASATRV